ncbi:MAG: TfoX/Sxy family protein [Gammaproteobacteria bacterium]|nr:TfoX/Sxy family protein [Gammaproteobacteria bacterium]
MHSDPDLVRRLFALLPDTLQPRKMFGGQCWMLNGNICVGVYKQFLITRIGVDAFERIADRPHVHPMDITGRPMKGWAKIGPIALADDRELQRQVDLAIRFVETLPAK